MPSVSTNGVVVWIDSAATPRPGDSRAATGFMSLGRGAGPFTADPDHAFAVVISRAAGGEVARRIVGVSRHAANDYRDRLVALISEVGNRDVTDEECKALLSWEPPSTRT